MKAIFILFDSLNRLALENYGGENVKTPNFSRLANKSIVFDKHYVGSMPCMPARRDLQSGRLSFLHRGWGPLEPFDNSFPEIMKKIPSIKHVIISIYPGQPNLKKLPKYRNIKTHYWSNIIQESFSEFKFHKFN